MADHRNLYISPNASVLEAMNIINENKIKIALVVDSNQKLLGTITDGDIRRNILGNNSTSTLVEDIMSKNYIYAKENTDRKNILKIMQEKKIYHLPIIDQNKKIIRIFDQKELLEKKEKNNPIVIMAGGKGERLRPHTLNTPKPMLEVNKKPILEIIIDHFITYGYKTFYISVNYLKEQIINYFGDGGKWNIEINYIYEEKPMGTAGSLKFLPRNSDIPYLITNGDVLSSFDPNRLIDYHIKEKASGTIMTNKYEFQIPYGVINTRRNRIKSFEEKPKLLYNINSGVYVIQPEILSLLNGYSRLDMPELFDLAAKEKAKVLVYHNDSYWIDIGKEESLIKANSEWLNINKLEYSE